MNLLTKETLIILSSIISYSCCDLFKKNSPMHANPTKPQPKPKQTRQVRVCVPKPSHIVLSYPLISQHEYEMILLLCLLDKE